MTEENPIQTQQAYAQAKKYGEELARLYAIEKARRRELETTTQKLQAIFDTAPNALAVIDNDFNIIDANPRFLLLFEQDNCTGKNLKDLLPVGSLLQTMQSLQSQQITLGSVEVEIIEPIPHMLLVALAPLSDGQGWVLILHDLTERKRLEGLKDEFINIAAHELRTPLGGVMGFVSVLRENLQEYDDPMLVHISDLILESTDRLKTIIDELVEFATAQQSSNDGLHIVDVNINWLLQKSAKYLQKHIKAKEITYKIELPSTLMTVRGDQFILSEVIYQLVKNAVMFNKQGGQIHIRVTQKPLADLNETFIIEMDNITDNDPVTIIEIEDTGIGIPQTDMERIFDKFYQIEEHLTRNIGGLGLGLTIARQGVEQHQGRLTVSSKLGEGSIFKITLPPISQLRDVSVDSRANVAHQQTLAYAKDMARAVASQLKIKQILNQVKTLSVALSQTMDQLATTEPESSSYKQTLKQLQQMVQELADLSQKEAD